MPDSTPPSLWEAIEEEAATYRFVAPPELQPRWDVPAKIAINVAVAGRAGAGLSSEYPVDIDEYVASASQVIEAGACGVHIDFSGVTDSTGRRLDKDLPPVEAYGMVLEPLRERFGNGFVANVNILNGKTFEECLSPVVAGLAEVAPCAAGHPASFVGPAVQALTDLGASPEIVVHSSGEVEMAKQRLFDTGILTGVQTNWIVLYGLPIDVGRSLISGAWVDDTRSMTTHLFLMVDQIRQLDPNASITVCNAGRGGIYFTTLATMLGLNIRVGLEDSLWKHPNSDTYNTSNIEIFNRARTVASELGREIATADEYRAMIGLPARS